jgi:hypothetical protein
MALSLEAQKRKEAYTKEWQKQYTKKYTIQLRKGKDDELIKFIDELENKNEVFKKLLLEYANLNK